jgi:hypothetical protein
MTEEISFDKYDGRNLLDVISYVYSKLLIILFQNY